MKKFLIIAGMVIIAAVVISILYKTGGPANSLSPSPSTSVVVSPGQSAKTFTVVGTDFSFDTPEIHVNKGDVVTIIFKNSEGIHDWVIDQFHARTARIGSGKTAQVTFVADTAGTFEYYCSVGEHRQMGMHGNLIVQ